MGIFKRAKRSTAEPDARVQLRTAEGHPFGIMAGYVPLKSGEVRLYRTIREAVPLIDAAIVKLIRLTGGFTVHCGDPTAEQNLNAFLKTVDAGRGQRGVHAFLDSYLDSLITCGRAVGEMVVSPGGTFRALLCGDVANIEIREGKSPLEFEICGPGPGGLLSPLPYQNLLLFTPFNPEADSPYGVSLLRSMPFLADILLKIYNTLGVNWERAGNVRFAVVYKPQGDALDRVTAQERSNQIAREWSNAMQASKNGTIRDFVAVGDVDIRVIGADNQVLDSEVPVRQILEQIVARTGIPPFMLGLSWSTTERMSAEQADVMTAEIAAIRRTLTPVVDRICQLWLTLNGYACGHEVIWDEFSIRDEEAQAHAALYAAQADYYRAQAEKLRRTPDSEGGETDSEDCQGSDDGGNPDSLIRGSDGD
jgi:hypothetical protein